MVFLRPKVRAKPGPTDGRKAGADDSATARSRRPSERWMRLGVWARGWAAHGGAPRPLAYSPLATAFGDDAAIRALGDDACLR